ncbi:uncharacterized protein TNCV_4333291 [Trichonephila clavipes]|nr:uncharacterized protein TNCV_4333291 [Trichonephila clavipes]
MTVPVVQSVNGLCKDRFTVRVSGAVDLREYHCSMLAIGLHILSGLRIWRQAHEAIDPACQVGNVQGHGGSIMDWGVFSWHCLGSWYVYQPPTMQFGMTGHHTAPTNLTELWTALVNIWQVIPVDRFQKLVESMPRRVAAVIKARGGPTRYLPVLKHCRRNLFDAFSGTSVEPLKHLSSSTFSLPSLKRRCHSKACVRDNVSKSYT